MELYHYRGTQGYDGRSCEEHNDLELNNAKWSSVSQKHNLIHISRGFQDKDLLETTN